MFASQHWNASNNFAFDRDKKKKKKKKKKTLDKTITTFKITWVKNPFTISHGKKGQKGVFEDDRTSLCWTSMCPSFLLNFDDNYWLDCPSFASNPLDIQFNS
jgi:hypothetical protein